jgi:hypothetical protein
MTSSFDPSSSLAQLMAYLGYGAQQGPAFVGGQPMPPDRTLARDLGFMGQAAQPLPPQLLPTAQGMPNPWGTPMGQTYQQANPGMNIMSMLAAMPPQARADFMAKYGRYFLQPGTAAYGDMRGARPEGSSYYARTAPATAARDTDPAGP